MKTYSEMTREQRPLDSSAENVGLHVKMIEQLSKQAEVNSNNVSTVANASL
jgi:hypothetical protein